MEDRLDELLTHLPLAQEVAPDLPARIIGAIAQRRQARAMRRRVGGAALACALAGISLVAISWPEASATLATRLAFPDASALFTGFVDLLTSPMSTITELVSSGLAWQVSLADSVGVVLSLGVVLLSIAAFGGLARMLQPGTWPSGSALSASGM